MSNASVANPGGIDALAVGIDQNNRDLQRQTNSFGHLREICARIDSLVSDPEQIREGLPFLIVRIPTVGELPDEFELDLNTLHPQYVQQLRPVFELMAQAAGGALLGAWDRIITLANEAQPIIESAKAQRQPQQPRGHAVTRPLGG